MTKTSNKLQNDYIRVLLATEGGDIQMALASINIEDIEDKTTKIICRTILGSIDALYEHFEQTEKETASISQ